MGLFDFITKSSSGTNNSQVQNGTSVQTTVQDDSQQGDRLVSTPFSEVKYPMQQPTQDQMSSSVQPLPAQYPTGTDTLNSEYTPNSQTFNPNPNLSTYDNSSQNQNYSGDLPPLPGEDTNSSAPVQTDYSQAVTQPVVEQVQDISNNPQVDTSVQQVQSDSSVAPTTQEGQLPELPDMTQASSAAAPQGQQEQSSEYLQYKPDFDQDVVPQQVSTESLPVQTENLPTTEVETNTLPESSTLDTNDQSENKVTTPESTNINDLQETSSKVEDNLSKPLTESNDSNNTDVLTDANNVSKSEPENAIKDTLVVGNEEEVPESTDQQKEGDVSSLENKDQEEGSETINPERTDIPDHSEKEKIVEGGPVDEKADLDKEIFSNIEKAVNDEYQNDDKPDIPETSIKPVVEEIPESEKESIGTFKVFDNVALVGLNTDLVNQGLNDELIKLFEKLASNNLNITVDSGRGYGENLLNKVMDYKTVKIKGVYLKPFYSDYTDEPKSKLNFDNYTTAVFSDLDSKLKYLIKSSDVFILPEVRGLSNLSLLFTILANAYLYFGQHKPVILLGKSWNDLMSSLKSTLKLNDTESNTYIVCNTADDVMSKLKELDEEYSKKGKVVVHKNIDMRSESDESDYFVNNI